MWIPKSLIIKRFMSHLETEYAFVQGVATMIYGMNRDDDAQESNGSGKSVLIEGVSMAFLGNALRDSRASELVMDGQKDLEIDMTLYNTQLDREMRIWRKVPIKGVSKLAIYIDNELQSDNIPSVRDGDKFILEQLDISKDDLLNYFIISKEKYTSFFAFGDAKKKEVIARFSNANIIDPVFDQVKSHIKTIDTELVALDRRELMLASKIETLNEQLQVPKVDHSALKKEEVEAAKERIKSGKLLVASKQAQLDEIEPKITTAQTALKSFSKVDFKKQLEAVDQSQVSFKKSIAESKIEHQEFNELLHELEHIIAGTIECPSCKYKFVLGKDIDAAEAAVMLPEVKEQFKDITETISKFQTQLDETEENRREVRAKERKQLNEWEVLDDAVRKLERDKTAHNYDLQRYSNALKEIEGSVEEINSRKIPEDGTKAIRADLKALKEEADGIEVSVKALEKEKAGHSEWIHKFTRFKSHLANKAIASIESFTTYYLQQMNTNLGVKMSGYGMKRDGTLSEKITTTVMRNGLEVASFGRFSGGEKVRIEVCNIVALQGLINLNSKSGGLDLLCLDEIIESVDGYGVTELMKALNLLNKTVLVITHTTHSGVYEHTVTVVKEGGHSKILAT